MFKSFPEKLQAEIQPKGPENQISACDEGKNDGFRPVFSTQSWEFRNWNLLGKPLRPILKRRVKAADSGEFASCCVVEPLLERFQKGNSHEIDSQTSEPFFQIQPSPGLYPRRTPGRDRHYRSPRRIAPASGPSCARSGPVDELQKQPPPNPTGNR
jgi:hypothetical protein